jgi:hypothetical protein
MGEINGNLALRSNFVRLASDVLHAVKSYDMGLSALLSTRRKVCCGFLSPKIYSAGSEHANLGSNGKQAEHYTTEATIHTVQSELI